MLPMLGACTTCTGMFWNGAAIGMEIIPAAPKPILKAPHRGRIGFCVGAAGTTAAGIAARRNAPTTPFPTASTALAFWVIPDDRYLKSHHRIWLQSDIGFCQLQSPATVP